MYIILRLNSVIENIILNMEYSTLLNNGIRSFLSMKIRFSRPHQEILHLQTEVNLYYMKQNYQKKINLL